MRPNVFFLAAGFGFLATFCAAQGNVATSAQTGDGNTATATQTGSANASTQSQGLNGGRSASDVSVVSQVSNNNVALTVQGNLVNSANNRAEVDQRGGDGNRAAVSQGAFTAAQRDALGFNAYPFESAAGSTDARANITQVGTAHEAVSAQSGAGNVAATTQTGVSHDAVIFQDLGTNEATIVQEGTRNFDFIAQESAGNFARTFTSGAGNTNNVRQSEGSANRGVAEVTGDDNHITTQQLGSGNESYLNMRNTPASMRPAGATFAGTNARNSVFISQQTTDNEASTFVAGTDNVVQLYQNGSNNTAGTGFDADGIQLSGSDNQVYGSQFGRGNVLDIDAAGDRSIITVDQFSDGNQADVNVIGNGNTSTIFQD